MVGIKVPLIFALPNHERRVRLRARTPPFHGGNTGSNPVRGTNNNKTPVDHKSIGVFVVNKTIHQQWFSYKLSAASKFSVTIIEPLSQRHQKLSQNNSC